MNNATKSLKTFCLSVVLLGGCLLSTAVAGEDNGSNTIKIELKDISPRYDRAVEEDPLKPEPYYSRARAYMKIDENKKALADLDSAVRLSGKPNANYLVTRGLVSRRLKQYDQAIADYRTVASLSAYPAPAAWLKAEMYQEIVEMYAEQGDEEKTVEAMKAAAAMGNYDASLELSRRGIPHEAGWTAVRFPVLPVEALFTKSPQTNGLSLSALLATDYGVTGVQVSFLSVTPRIIGMQIGAFPSASELSGVQVGAMNNVIFLTDRTPSVKGVQLGLLGNEASKLKGAQVSNCNFAADMSGMQFGFLNLVGNPDFPRDPVRGSGFQLGLVNVTTGPFKGLQLGVVNYTQSLTGLQIGALNIIVHPNSTPMQVLPVINWSL